MLNYSGSVILFVAGAIIIYASAIEHNFLVFIGVFLALVEVVASEIKYARKHRKNLL